MSPLEEMDRNGGFYRKRLETMPFPRKTGYLHRKLIEILRYAHQHSPAIRQKMDSAGATPKDIKTIQDLEKLPITPKADLIEIQKKNPPFGGFEGIPIGKLRRIFVSPGPIYEPGEADCEELGWAQALYAGGFRPGDIVLNTFNYHMVPFALNMLDNALYRVGCVTVPTGVGNTEQQVQVMKYLQATGFCGTPSFLLQISEKAEEMGLNPREDLRLRVGLVAAEMLPESLRSKLENKFGAILRQSYGTADIGCLGYECMEKKGLHVPDDKIVEIVDPETGKALAPGKVGEVVGTTFNKAYPLIRFGTGDLSFLTDEPCRCGRTSPRLVRIMGRIDQATKVRGLFIHPGQVDEVAGRHPEIHRYQMVITRKGDKDEMTLRVELKENVILSEKGKEEIEKSIREVMKLRGEVKEVSTGTIGEGIKKIIDQRIWE